MGRTCPGDEDELGELAVLVNHLGVGELNLAVIEGLGKVIQARSGLTDTEGVGLALERQQEPNKRSRRVNRFIEKDEEEEKDIVVVEAAAAAAAAAGGGGGGGGEVVVAVVMA